MKTLFSIFLMTMISVVSQAKEIAGVNLPDSMNAQNQALALNGAGIRSKFFMDIYAAGLYLAESSQEAKSIIAQDKPMALRLHITSGLLSSEKMESATREGFEKSTGGNTAEIKDTIETFIATFKDGIVENDVFDFVYVPSAGVNVFKNGELKTTVEGLKFKQALFGIWLSEDAVQSDLKEGLLGSL
ncbi:MAG: chalcone isomerase [Bermanella sp.]|nr:chalcone isomerase [Bermanella sp.]|tara:strand:+ start:3242 stop:3802 length:561 start_codon:yes stop_codon:yes gene_type:complete